MAFGNWREAAEGREDIREWQEKLGNFDNWNPADGPRPEDPGPPPEIEGVPWPGHDPRDALPPWIPPPPPLPSKAPAPAPARRLTAHKWKPGSKS